jgi:hypothetical protein
VAGYLSLNFSRHGVGANAWLRLGRRMELRTSPQGLPGCFVVQADYSEWQHTAQANKERPYPIKWAAATGPWGIGAAAAACDGWLGA